ncbi:IS1595 family transposase [Sphingobium sp. LSP13-1-1.1]|uniref:IS1595 family transposase n=1 Tax=Sphingobium sp. LSP13-1-1.1 TaxID=3135234 RepID=UPI00342E88A2
MSVLSRPEFHSEEAAFAHLERIIWSDGVVCTHCGCMGRVTKVKANPAKRIREGLWRCGDCKKQFTVKIGTVFEHMRLPLHKALQAVYLMTSSKKGVSAHQLHRTLEITYKSAWFLAHRIREAMRAGELDLPFGNTGGAVEMDETFIGIEPGVKMGKGGVRHKMKVVTLVDRETGRARSMVVDKLNINVVTGIAVENIAREAYLMTDDAGFYRKMRYTFTHGYTRHAKGEYVDGIIHTNTVEGYFSIFKRGMKGVYQHCAKKHLHRYLAEFDFRYSNREAVGFNDADRSVEAMKGIVGKRLTYKGPNAATAA